MYSLNPVCDRAQSACFSPCDLRLEMDPAADVFGKTRKFSRGGEKSRRGLRHGALCPLLSSPRFTRSPENTERQQSPPPRGRAAVRVSDGRGTHVCHLSRDRGIFRTARSFSLRADASGVTPAPPPLGCPRSSSSAVNGLHGRVPIYRQRLREGGLRELRSLTALTLITSVLFKMFFCPLFLIVSKQMRRKEAKGHTCCTS